MGAHGQYLAVHWHGVLGLVSGTGCRSIDEKESPSVCTGCARVVGVFSRIRTCISLMCPQSVVATHCLVHSTALLSRFSSCACFVTYKYICGSSKMYTCSCVCTRCSLMRAIALHIVWRGLACAGVSSDETAPLQRVKALVLSGRDTPLTPPWTVVALVTACALRTHLLRPVQHEEVVIPGHRYCPTCNKHGGG